MAFLLGQTNLGLLVLTAISLILVVNPAISNPISSILRLSVRDLHSSDIEWNSCLAQLGRHLLCGRAAFLLEVLELQGVIATLSLRTEVVVVDLFTAFFAAWTWESSQLDTTPDFSPYNLALQVWKNNVDELRINMRKDNSTHVKCPPGWSPVFGSSPFIISWIASISSQSHIVFLLFPFPCEVFFFNSNWSNSLISESPCYLFISWPCDPASPVPSSSIRVSSLSSGINNGLQCSTGFTRNTKIGELSHK